MANSDTSGILCGDCNATDPEWASLNRGILLCKDCCYIHRTLGPQYSRVKSLKHSAWHPNLKKMVVTLAAASANYVWEYTLLTDSSKGEKSMKKKPLPNDPMEPKKRKFITAKHLSHAFVNRHKSASVNNELHSTVRTGDVGTALRLLASGGDPNFFHPDLGTRPLHVAARSGQPLQVELLVLYAAQTDALDYLGQTPVEHALAAGHKDLALRLLELRYQLTDQLSYFVCSKMPDHSTSKHIIIPPESSLGLNRAKQQIQLRNQQPLVLEQLAADLYDEVDRRQLEALMLEANTGPLMAKYSVAFLPVHSFYHSVRNQTRQKFARLNNVDLSSLITLVLFESKRRHCKSGIGEIDVTKDIFTTPEITEKDKVETAKSSASVEDDDFPLYDNVASDEEVNLTEEQTLLSSRRSATQVSPLNTSNTNPVSSCDSSSSDGSRRISAKLAESELKIQDLLESNNTMKREIQVLQKMIVDIINENLELRQNRNGKGSRAPTECLVNGHVETPLKRTPAELLKRPPRPLSMYDARTGNFDPMVVRPNSTEDINMRNRHNRNLPGISEIVQSTTKRVVELIKVLLQQATSNDVGGVQMTVSHIQEETQSMAARVFESLKTTEMKIALQNVLFEVLRMKSEIAIEANKSYIYQQGSAEGSSDFVHKVKQACFNVGAAMKTLVSKLPLC